MRANRSRGVWLLAVAAVLLLAAAVLLYLRLYRAEQRVDEGVRADVAQTAADVSAALLTYTPDTVAADMYAATQRLTGEFKDRYGRLTDTAIVPSARAQKITTAATVTGAGVTDLTADHADALVFLRQVTTTAAAPEPVTATVGAVVELTRVNGEWLVSDLAMS